MEHATITPIDETYSRITPDAGYALLDTNTNRVYSDVFTEKPEQYKAIAKGVDPTPHERTLDDAKAEKLAALASFCAADKYFTIGNKKMWAGPEKRANLKNAAEALNAQGVESVQYEGIEIPISTALQMLSAVEAYAALHTMNEERHKATINAKRAISTVDSYDFTTGYPPQLTFSL